MPASAAQPSVAGIVLAAMSGTRFGGLKQFERIHGKRLVDRAVDFLADRCDPVVVVVLPAAYVAERCTSSVTAVAGGASRLASLRAGVSAVPASSEIVIA